jgi:hypothetical protein
LFYVALRASLRIKAIGSGKEHAKSRLKPVDFRHLGLTPNWREWQ